MAHDLACLNPVLMGEVGVLEIPSVAAAVPPAHTTVWPPYILQPLLLFY